MKKFTALVPTTIMIIAEVNQIIIFILMEILFTAHLLFS